MSNIVTFWRCQPPFTRVTFYSYLNVLFTSIQSQQNIDWKRWVWNIRQLWKHFNCCSGQVNHCQSMTRVEVIKLDKIIKLQLLVKYVSWADGSEVWGLTEQKMIFFRVFILRHFIRFSHKLNFIRFNIWPNNKQLSVAQQSSSTIRAGSNTNWREFYELFSWIVDLEDN